MIVNASGGGGGLNFKVVGGATQPNNPKENTIWVNTDAEITSWIFATEQPTGTEGMVWVKTTESSAVEFNALKKNCITVYPSSCKQYISGAWRKTAKIYQGGVWNDLVTYLYKIYDECTDLTGGWVTGGYQWSGSGSEYAVAPSKTQYSTGLYISLPSSSLGRDSGVLRTSKTVNLTNVNTIKMIVPAASISGSYSGAYLQVRQSLSGYAGTGASAALTINSDSAEREYNLDVSKLTGDFYICIVLTSGSEGIAVNLKEMSFT